MEQLTAGKEIEEKIVNEFEVFRKYNLLYVCVLL